MTRRGKKPRILYEDVGVDGGDDSGAVAAVCVSSGTGGPARLTVKKAFFFRGWFVGRRLRPPRSFGLPPLAAKEDGAGGGRCSRPAVGGVCYVRACLCSAEDRAGPGRRRWR